MSPAAIRRLSSKESSKVCVFPELRREAIWTDNRAQVVRWAGDSARLRADDHRLALSTYTTFGGTIQLVTATER
jgi:hypothetical protein